MGIRRQIQNYELKLIGDVYKSESEFLIILISDSLFAF